MLNATWLETFVTLTEIGHFTRAAEKLNMTQPGVSQHLRKLEEQLGQSLIAQEGKSFTLTPAGEAVRDLGLSRRFEERQLRDTIMADDPDVADAPERRSPLFEITCRRVAAMRLPNPQRAKF